MPDDQPHSIAKVRIAEEDRLTEQAEAEALRDGTIPAEELFAWLESLDHPNPLPRPEPRKDEMWRRMTEARAQEKTEKPSA